MKELVPDDRFLDASWRMTEAWGKMVDSGQLKRYLGLGKEDIEELIRGGSSEENDYIFQYLMAMQDLLEASKA